MQETATQEVLAGLVERVTFHNADSGFCVLRIQARSHRDLVTVVGHAATISPGEWVTASGEWINDRTHGQQFKARFMRTSEPTSIDGIEKYLGSGMIRGIGPVYAKKMVKAFGEKVFDIIEAEPDRLREVTGIGAVRAKRITEAWAAPRFAGLPSPRALRPADQEPPRLHGLEADHSVARVLRRLLVCARHAVERPSRAQVDP
jgi:exodeoxyribonuclease V alpha subunit